MSHGRLFRIASEWQKKKENNLEGLERYEKNMENESSSTVTYGGLYGRGVVCGVCG